MRRLTPPAHYVACIGWTKAHAPCQHAAEQGFRTCRQHRDQEHEQPTLPLTTGQNDE